MFRLTKRKNLRMAFPLSLMLCFECFGIASWAQPDFDELARRVVHTCVNVKPGEVVMVSGGKHNLALMESLAIEANKAGGMTTMVITTDRVDRSFNVDVPEEYLGQEPKYFADWMKEVDVYIGLPTDEDAEAVTEGVPEVRLAKAAKAGQAITDMLMNAPKLRGIFIGYPTKEDTAAMHVD